MIAKLLSLLFFVSISASLTACSNGKGKANPNIYPPMSFEVTRSNFINGDKFCELYSSVGGREYGRLITVPKDYSNPYKGSLKIYAFSSRPFNPSLPTYVFVDGGPGQNTHGMDPFLEGEYNELKFDQRGLGCSTPRTFDEYFDSTLYSTENTARDMDVIRRAYGISKWSVYGLSYGTQPATVYGSMFGDHVTSVVLEGTVGGAGFTHPAKYKVEKWNLVLSTLNSDQKNALRDLIYEETSDGDSTLDSSTIWDIFDESTYNDAGLQTLKQDLTLILNTDGSVNREHLQKYRNYQLRDFRRFRTAQRPGGVDRNIHSMIMCKEFSKRTVPMGNVTYDYDSGFAESSTSVALARQNKVCDQMKVKVSQEQPYDLNKHPISKPVYYFQGSHDGATTALGAFEHWRLVPKGPVTFALAKLGGHNPAINSLYKGEASRQAQQFVLLKALSAQPLADADFKPANDVRNDQFDWVYFNGAYNGGAVGYLGGM